ncbi:MAG: hypothetical protein EON84_11390, partial [Bradyrhizobiaceae bacterium]
MKKIVVALATIAALGAATMTTKPAEARGGRNAAIGFGLAAGALAAGAAASGAYAYGPGYYGGGPRYYGGGPRYYGGPR